MDAQPFASLASKRAAGAEAIYWMSICRVLNDRTSNELILMSRVAREYPEEEAACGARFRQILAEVRSAEANRGGRREGNPEPSGFSANPFANTIFSIDDRPPTAGGGSPWDAAFAWIEERDEPAALVESRRPADDSAEAILSELGLNENLTYDQLNQARRLYMWRNHPDRHSEAQRESATRRVAIANMLVDRAQARLAGGRRT
jgi:hypothetical protein